MSNKKSFGEHIREYREKKGLSLRALAKKLGVSHVYLGDVERGKASSLSRKHWAKLLKALPGLSRSKLEASIVVTVQLRLRADQLAALKKQVPRHGTVEHVILDLIEGQKR